MLSRPSSQDKELSPFLEGAQITKEDLWKSLQLHTDLYKSYLTMAVQLFSFGIAAAGAVVTYYLANTKNNGLVVWSLGVPILLNLMFCGLMIWGAVKAVNSSLLIREVTRHLGFRIYPATQILSGVLWLFGVFHLLVAASLLLVGIIFR